MISLRTAVTSTWLRTASAAMTTTASRSSSSPGSGRNNRGNNRILTLGLATGIALGSGLGIMEMMERGKNKGKAEEATIVQSKLLDSPPPKFAVARSIKGHSDNTGLKLTLFQYQTCPFCCKARAFLDYFGLSYDVIEVNSVMRTQVKWSKYKKVPILVAEIPGSKQVIQLNDSSMIVSALFSFLSDRNQSLVELASCYPVMRFKDDEGREKIDIMNKYFVMKNEKKASSFWSRDSSPEKAKAEAAKERKWRKWVDDELVHKLSPNVYRTPSEALQAFRWFDRTGEWERHFASWERYLVIYVGSAAMWLIGKRLKRRYGLKDDVRESLYDDLNLWTGTLESQGTPFLGGSRPNLADLGVYGALSAIEGCDAFEDALKETDIRRWFTDMKRLVGERAGREILQTAGK